MMAPKDTQGRSGGKKRRITKDNVVYVNFGAQHPPRSPAPSPGRSATSAAQTAGNATATTPDPGGAPRLPGSSLPRQFRSSLGRALAERAEQGTDGGRLSRGKSYWRSGHVIGVHLAQGAIHGEVSGTQLTPFTATIGLPFRSAKDVGELTHKLAQTPASLSAAQKGILTRDSLEIVFAREDEPLRVTCTCPDNAQWCKHLVAVALQAASLVDKTPARAFELRGLNLDNLAADIHARLKKAAAVPAPEKFWDGGKLPEVPESFPPPALGESDPAALRRAMRAASFTAVDELQALADIEDIYEFLITESGE